MTVYFQDPSPPTTWNNARLTMWHGRFAGGLTTGTAVPR